MQEQTIIGVDLGGTKVEAARVRGQSIVATKKRLVSSGGTEEQVLQEVTVTTAYWSPLFFEPVPVPDCAI